MEDRSRSCRHPPLHRGHHEYGTSIKPFQHQAFSSKSKLLKITKEVPGRSEAENDNEAVLLRSYGRDSDIMIDREMEVTTHVLLAERGLAAPLLARFRNGLLYRFLPGRVCQANDLKQESIWQAVAVRLGEWHARLPMPSMKTENSSSGEDPGNAGPKRETDQRVRQYRTIWTVFQEWLDAIPSKSEKERLQQQRLQVEFDKYFRELNGDAREDVGDVHYRFPSIASQC